MSVFKVASRYAKSLIDLAEEQNKLEIIKNDMVGFIALIQSNSQLKALLSNPIVPLLKKANILNDILANQVDADTLAFFKLMINKGRGEILLATAKEVVAEYNLKKGIVKATVISAVPMEATQLAALQTTLKQQLAANELDLTNTVDPSLIGGFVVKVGDQQFDASISGKFNRLEKYLEQSI